MFLNGDWVCSTDEPHALTEALRSGRRCGALHSYTSIAWDPYIKQIWIACDAGRCLRPLYIVHQPESGFPTHMDLSFTLDMGDALKRGKLRLNDLCVGNEAKGIKPCLEYLDVLETNTRMIAMNIGKLMKNHDRDRVMHYNYTHMELSPSL